ncbi:hypothetical protein EMCRGX_G028707 [Ephydatia muelleri]
MVGRAQTCDVVIKHMSVSNLHCEIGVEGDEDPPRCYVKDLSSNGTWVRRWTGDREGHSKAERLKKGATFPLGSGDLVLLLPPTHADCLAFQLRVSCDPLKRCAVLCDTQNLTSIYARTERPDVVEETGRKIPKRCKEHLLGGIRRDPENESLHSAVEGRNGALRARPPSILQCTDGQSGEEHVYPTVTMVKEPCMPNLHSNCCKELCLAGESHDLMKEQKASETMATPSILTSVAMKDTAHLCTNEGGSHTPVTTPPAKGVTSPAKGTTPPVTTPPGGAEEELCPLCGCIFPLSMLVAHCESCSGGVGGRGPLSATPPRTPPLLTAPASLRPTVSLEQCPKCSALFSLPELIPHWEVCSKKGANKVVCEEDGGDCVEQCIHCLKDYLLSDLLEHVKTCPMKDKKCHEEEQCQHCLKSFPLSELVEHIHTCTHHITDGSQGALERCMHCFRDFPLSSLVHHTAVCTEGLSGPKERFKGFIPSVHDLDATAIAVLNDTQRRAVDYVIERSRADSERAYPSLVKRACALGYLEKDVQRTLHWVRNEAPIIIHIRLERVLGFLVKDTHYRNQFETRTSGGSTDLSARGSWEDNIFNKIYASSPPFERVKYGVLNIVGDPCGVRSCYHYGDSFLQLKKVRLRTTFASMDTSSSAVKLSCCEHYGNVLYEYTDSELKAILDVATRRVSSMKSDMIANYKEVQIHGPVCLSENVECIVANHRHHGDTSIETLLEEFVKRNGCNLIWMDPDDHPGSSSLATSIATLPHRSHYIATSYRRRHRKRRRRDYYDD